MINGLAYHVNYYWFLTELLEILKIDNKLNFEPLQTLSRIALSKLPFAVLVRDA